MNLTDNNILEIINACKGHVKTLKMSNGQLEIEFIVPHQPLDLKPLTHNQGNLHEIPDSENVVKNLYQPIPAIRVDQEDLIDNLHITDPLALEEAIAHKEVSDVTEET